MIFHKDDVMLEFGSSRFKEFKNSVKDCVNKLKAEYKGSKYKNTDQMLKTIKKELKYDKFYTCNVTGPFEYIDFKSNKQAYCMHIFVKFANEIYKVAIRPIIDTDGTIINMDYLIYSSNLNKAKDGGKITEDIFRLCGNSQSLILIGHTNKNSQYTFYKLSDSLKNRIINKYPDAEIKLNIEPDTDRIIISNNSSKNESSILGNVKFI